jgi:hypothetical protein
VRTRTVPEDLRRRIEDDLGPVRPLAPVWRRTLLTACCATGIFVLSLVVIPLRSDMPMLPLWLSWGASLLELGLGVLLIGMSLREAVPGQALPTPTVVLAVVTAMALQVAVGIGSWLLAPGLPEAVAEVISSIDAGMTCLRHDASLALPTLVVTLLLVLRALPVRPSVAGLLGGCGAGMSADAITHLVCPMADLRHVLVWHSGAIVLLGLIGWLLGLAWERLRRRSATPEAPGRS